MRVGFAFANLIVLVSIWRTFRARKNNGRIVDKDFDFTLLEENGNLTTAPAEIEFIPRLKT